MTGPSSSRKTTYLVPFILHPVAGLVPFVTNAERRQTVANDRVAEHDVQTNRKRWRDSGGFYRGRGMNAGIEKLGIAF